MPTRDTAPIGAPCWVDLSTSDTGSVREFYSQLFGWQAGEPIEEFGGYFNFTKDGHEIAGCMPNIPESQTSEGWTIHLATDDVRKTLEAATANGATVTVEPMPVGDLGVMAHIKDPTGAGVGIWQAGQFHGFREFGEPNTPGWFELHTQDYDRAVAFYRDALRWDTEVASDAPTFRYTMQKSGSQQLAGIFDSAAVGKPGPAHWALYMGVADTAAAVAEAQRLGGSVVQPAEDTPYGCLAVITDPAGNRLSLVGPNDAMRTDGS